MGSVSVRHKGASAAVIQTMLATSSDLYADMFKRAVRVQSQARKNLSRPPQRIDTGALRASISVTPLRWHGLPAFRVGTNMKYALFVHDGTGIYGPKHHLITPTHAQVMVFKSRRTGKNVFTRTSRGMPGNPFLKDALSAAKT